MDDSVQIRKALPDDAEGMLRVQQITWLATYPNKDEGITKEDVKAKLDEMAFGAIERRRKHIKEENSSMFYLIAAIHNQIIGMLMGTKSDNKNKLAALYIIPEYQGMGIGSQLMGKVLGWFDSDKKTVLEVAAYNSKAIAFYRKFGFIENGPTTSGVAKLPSGKIIPEIEMVK
jgi:ribosomal protein S18 acetylase RimI-like enzyme